MELGNLNVRISALDRPFHRALDVGHRAFVAHSRRMARVAAASARTLFVPFAAAARQAGTAWTRLLAVAGPSAAAGAIGGTLRKAVMEASDLGETITKVQQVFGRSTGVVNAAADEMARRFGVTRRTFLDAAAGMGLVGKASGLAQKEAAELGVHFTKLAVDASSFFNVGIDEALMSFRSGLVGEAEPMRRFGVLLSEAAVKAEALRLGLSRGKKELSEGAKVQARASLITKGLADATGDLERTSGSLANRLRKLQGQWLNMLAVRGEKLMPVAQAMTTALMQVVRDVGGTLTFNSARIKAWADSLAKSVRIAGLVWREWPSFVRLATIKVQEKLMQLGEVFDRLKTKLGNVLSSLGEYLMEMFSTIGENMVNAMLSAIGKKLGGGPIGKLLDNFQAGTSAALSGLGKGGAQKPLPKFADAFSKDKLNKGLPDGLFGNLANKDAETVPILKMLGEKLDQIKMEIAKGAAKPTIKAAFENAAKAAKDALSGKGSAKAEVAARNKALGLTGGPELSTRQAERVAAYRRRQAAIREAKEKERAQRSLARTTGAGLGVGPGNLAARALRGAGFGERIADAARVAAAGAVGGVHGAAAAAGVVGQTGRKKPTRGRRGRPKAKEGDDPFDSERLSLEGLGRGLQTAALSRSAEDIASRTAKATEATAKELGPGGKVVQLLEKLANAANKPAVAG